MATRIEADVKQQRRRALLPQGLDGGNGLFGTAGIEIVDLQITDAAVQQLSPDDLHLDGRARDRDVERLAAALHRERQARALLAADAIAGLLHAELLHIGAVYGKEHIADLQPGCLGRAARRDGGNGESGIVLIFQANGHADADIGIGILFLISRKLIGADVIAPAVARRRHGSGGQLVAELCMIQPIDIACVEQGHDLPHLGKIVIIRRALLSALQQRHARKRQCEYDHGRGKAADDIRQDFFL